MGDPFLSENRTYYGLSRYVREANSSSISGESSQTQATFLTSAPWDKGGLLCHS